MKKNLVVLLFVLAISKVSSQVIFGNSAGTASDKTSVLMEFPNTGNRGLILPYVTDKSAITAAGSIILDASIPTDAKVKYYTGTTWVDLSVQSADVSSYLTIQPPAKENSTAKVIIGDNTSSTDGVLVLESTNKAMVLPIVPSYQNIINPAPGTMALVNNGGIKTLAVYNGIQWSFWSY
ncbi:hypothetical protein [Epilithonimonas sp.]|uniref:hypothetical protein n=1 Tax=Epilithonimonas sp. TaxID=2894511 RepID=UPI00289C76FC|nr:hypothetical protein [Epilithonimonas sp.]